MKLSKNPPRVLSTSSDAISHHLTSPDAISQSQIAVLTGLCLFFPWYHPPIRYCDHIVAYRISHIYEGSNPLSFANAILRSPIHHLINPRTSNGIYRNRIYRSRIYCNCIYHSRIYCNRIYHSRISQSHIAIPYRAHLSLPRCDIVIPRCDITITYRNSTYHIS